MQKIFYPRTVARLLLRIKGAHRTIPRLNEAARVNLSALLSAS